MINTTSINVNTEQSKKQTAIRFPEQLSLRDYFAAKAMPFELTESDDYATVARRCFSVADAMLKARGEA